MRPAPLLLLLGTTVMKPSASGFPAMARISFSTPRSEASNAAMALSTSAVSVDERGMRSSASFTHTAGGGTVGAHGCEHTHKRQAGHARGGARERQRREASGVPVRRCSRAIPTGSPSSPDCFGSTPSARSFLNAPLVSKRTRTAAQSLADDPASAGVPASASGSSASLASAISPLLDAAVMMSDAVAAASWMMTTSFAPVRATKASTSSPSATLSMTCRMLASAFIADSDGAAGADAGAEAVAFAGGRFFAARSLSSGRWRLRVLRDPIAQEPDSHLPGTCGQPGPVPVPSGQQVVAVWLYLTHAGLSWLSLPSHASKYQTAFSELGAVCGLAQRKRSQDPWWRAISLCAPPPAPRGVIKGPDSDCVPSCGLEFKLLSGWRQAVAGFRCDGLAAAVRQLSTAGSGQRGEPANG